MTPGCQVEPRLVEELYINIDPIQAGGRLTGDAIKAVNAYADGYSVCDFCTKPFRLDYIRKPGLDEFHRDLARFVSMDAARVVPGARRGFQAIASTYVDKGDPVLLTSLSHYTEFLAVEQSGGVPCEVPAREGNIIMPDAVADTVEEVTRVHQRAPRLMFIEHVDYSYGNVHPVKEIARVLRQYDVMLAYNGAYTVGIMDVDGRDLGADFVVGSGHKSMAAPAPSGILATTSEHQGEVFRTTRVKGDRTGRTFGIKEVEMMGCTLMGSTVIGMMASFPHVQIRVKNFQKECDHANEVALALVSIPGTSIESEMPRKHPLTRVNTTGSFDRVAKTHKKKGFFFTTALKERGITGIIPGATRVWKYNTFGLSDRQNSHVATSFRDIAHECGLLQG